MSTALPLLLLLEELPPLDAAPALLVVLLLLPHAAMASTAPLTSSPVSALLRTNLIQPPVLSSRAFHVPVTAQRNPVLGRLPSAWPSSLTEHQPGATALIQDSIVSNHASIVSQYGSPPPAMFHTP